MTCGIYKIQNKINGKCYIGQSINIYKRWQEHKSNSINKNHEDSYYPLYCAIRKYGIDNFDFSIIEECNQEELNNKEIYWVKYYNSFENGYNQTLGGNTNPLFYPRGCCNQTICKCRNNTATCSEPRGMLAYSNRPRLQNKSLLSRS